MIRIARVFNDRDHDADLVHDVQGKVQTLDTFNLGFISCRTSRWNPAGVHAEWGTFR